MRDNTCRVEGGRGARPTGSRPFPVPAHQTGRAHFEHPAFRQTSPRAHAGLSSCFAFVYSFLRSFRILNGVSRLIVNHLSVAPSGSMSEVRPLPSPGITRLPRRSADNSSRSASPPSSTIFLSYAKEDKARVDKIVASRNSGMRYKSKRT